MQKPNCDIEQIYDRQNNHGTRIYVEGGAINRAGGPRVHSYMRDSFRAQTGKNVFETLTHTLVWVDADAPCLTVKNGEPTHYTMKDGVCRDRRALHIPLRCRRRAPDRSPARRTEHWSIHPPDPEGGTQPYTTTVTGVPSWASHNPVSDTVLGTPPRAQEFTLTYTVEDAKGATAVKTYDIVISESEDEITVRVADAEAFERSSRSTLSFRVTLGRVARESWTLDYETSDGTATAGADYTATRGTLTFKANEIEKYIQVPVLDDQFEDSGETMTLTLSNPSLSRVTLVDAEATGTIRNDDPLPPLQEDDEETPDAIAASWSDAPAEHDGSSAFTMDLTFSHAPRGLGFRTVEGGLFDVTGGSITKVRRLTRGRNTGWELTVSPGGTGDVTLRARATTDCAAAHAVCDAEGRKFPGGLATTIPGPDSSAQDEPPAPITASWSSVPAEHGGAAGTFAVRLDFSRNPKGFSYRWLASSVVAVEGGSIARVWRRTKGRNDRWGIEVEPAGFGPATLTVNATTDCAASKAVCASDGGMLQGGARAQVAGPVTVSVADAEVEEGPGATLAFTVTLSRSAGEAVTVNYATSDGTAAAGSDYTATSGSLQFGSGQTEKTVSVAVLDDVHDEGEETLTLTLSNPIAVPNQTGRFDGAGEDQEHGPDAGGVDRALRAHGGGAGDGGGGGPHPFRGGRDRKENRKHPGGESRDRPGGDGRDGPRGAPAGGGAAGGGMAAGTGGR